jgi:hypothetical protein
MESTAAWEKPSKVGGTKFQLRDPAQNLGVKPAHGGQRNFRPGQVSCSVTTTFSNDLPGSGINTLHPNTCVHQSAPGNAPRDAPDLVGWCRLAGALAG